MTRYFNETDTSFNNYYVEDVINELANRWRRKIKVINQTYLF